MSSYSAFCISDTDLACTPQPIDKCSTIYIEEVASASRPRKSYSWSTTHAPLDAVLKTISTKTVENLPASLIPEDTDIVITATSTDFLGTVSLPAVFRLRLNSLPAPKVMMICRLILTLTYHAY